VVPGELTVNPVAELFETFKSGGLAHLQQARNQAMAESLHLDFKLAEKNAAPMTPKDRQSLGEALSGFANSDGGIVVWGVRALSQAPDEPDVVKELKPIQNLELFLSDLRVASAQVVSPGIVGVDHFPIQDYADSTAGYVMTYVPRSDDLHMAVAKDQHRYYYRTNTSFLKMEAFMVADRYGRRPQPRLEVVHEFARSRPAHNTPGHRYLYAVGIRNVGRGIALYPALSVGPKGCRLLDEFGLDGNHRTGLTERLERPRRPEEAVRVFVGGVNDAIHPGTTLWVTCVSQEIPSEALITNPLSFEYEVHCQGFSAQGEVSIPAEEFMRRRGY
jgi:hypothetical protein